MCVYVCMYYGYVYVKRYLDSRKQSGSKVWNRFPLLGADRGLNKEDKSLS